MDYEVWTNIWIGIEIFLKVLGAVLFVVILTYVVKAIEHIEIWVRKPRGKL